MKKYSKKMKPRIIRTLALNRIQNIIAQFASEVAWGKVEIYNEFSLQHELGIFLRQNLHGNKVYFEKNVTSFGLNKTKFIKKEIDISVFSYNKLPSAAIELKYPKNGKYPEEMFSFCKDLQFMAQLKEFGVKETYVVIFVDDRLFYEGTKKTGIYSFFRDSSNLSGEITKPTGKKDKMVVIKGSYQVHWNPIIGARKYTIIKTK